MTRPPGTINPSAPDGALGEGGGSGGQSITLEEAAAALGVHYMTAYRYIRVGRLRAERRHGRWWVATADVEQLREESRALPGRGQAQSPRRWAGPRTRLIERLMAGDSPGSWAIVEQCLAGGAAATDVYLQLLAPVLRSIGDRWAEGSIGVDVEHRASAVAMRLVGRLSPHFTRPGLTRTGTVMLGGAPGDPHLLPLVMVADILRLAGIHVMDLGPNLPERSFLEVAASTNDLRAIGISVSTDAAKPRVARVAAKLHRAHPDVPIFVGGPALPTRVGGRDLGADDWAGDASGLIRLLDLA